MMIKGILKDRSSMATDELIKKAGEFNCWFYPYDLGNGKNIPATDLKYNALQPRRLKYILSEAIKIIAGVSLNGIEVLDCGCNSGFFSFACAASGARHVLGLEIRDEFLEQASLLNSYFKFPNVEFRKMNISEISSDKVGQFDIVLAMGIIPYLENAAGFLKNICQIAKKYILVDSLVVPSEKVFFQSRTHSNPPYGGFSDDYLVPSIGVLKNAFSVNGFQSFTLLDADEVSENYKKKEAAALVVSKEKREDFELLENRR